MPGPVASREADLARPRERRGSGEMSVTRGESIPASVPHASTDWHPVARKMWDSLKTSGQREFYEQSDWAFAYALMDDFSDYKKSTRKSSQMAQVLYQNMGRLLITEADRRAVRIELHEPEADEDEASVTAINSYRAALEVVPN